MNEHPILMSGALVRATLSGLKTQTRRLVRFPEGTNWQPAIKPDSYGSDDFCFIDQGDPCGTYPTLIQCPFGVVGDRLWVRETWTEAEGMLYYRATDREIDEDERLDGMCWRPSIHMPRRAARLTLEVTSIRVERLQDISEEDIAAEGCTVDKVAAWTGVPWSDMPTLHHAWRAAWNHINGERCPYASNPWVWVIGFRKVTP